MQTLQSLAASPLAAAPASQGNETAPTELSEDAKMRFEKLLWAELLTHTGL